MNAETLRQLHSVYQRQKTQTANSAIQSVTDKMLDLALQCFGPMNDPTMNAANTSQAMALTWYAERNEEFAALLYMAGMGEALKLPKPEQKHFDRWGAVQARAHHQPPHRKARKGR